MKFIATLASSALYWAGHVLWLCSRRIPAVAYKPHLALLRLSAKISAESGLGHWRRVPGFYSHLFVRGQYVIAYTKPTES